MIQIKQNKGVDSDSGPGSAESMRGRAALQVSVGRSLLVWNQSAQRAPFGNLGDFFRCYCYGLMKQLTPNFLGGRGLALPTPPLCP